MRGRTPRGIWQVGEGRVDAHAPSPKKKKGGTMMKRAQKAFTLVLILSAILLSMARTASAASFIDGIWSYSGTGTFAGFPVSVVGECAFATVKDTQGNDVIVNYTSKGTIYNRHGQAVYSGSESYNQDELGGGIVVRNGMCSVVRDGRRTDLQFTDDHTALARKTGYAGGYLVDMTYTASKQGTGGNGGGGGGGGCATGSETPVALLLLPLAVLLLRCFSRGSATSRLSIFLFVFLTCGLLFADATPEAFAAEPINQRHDSTAFSPYDEGEAFCTIADGAISLTVRESNFVWRDVIDLPKGARYLTKWVFEAKILSLGSQSAYSGAGIWWGGKNASIALVLYPADKGVGFRVQSPGKSHYRPGGPWKSATFPAVLRAEYDMESLKCFIDGELAFEKSLTPGGDIPAISMVTQCGFIVDSDRGPTTGAFEYFSVNGNK